VGKGPLGASLLSPGGLHGVLGIAFSTHGLRIDTNSTSTLFVQGLTSLWWVGGLDLNQKFGPQVRQSPETNLPSWVVWHVDLSVSQSRPM
jgi:hypothetical protein